MGESRALNAGKGPAPQDCALPLQQQQQQQNFNILNSRGNEDGSGEMAQLLKYLPPKQEDKNWDSQQPCASQVDKAATCNSSTEEPQNEQDLPNLPALGSLRDCLNA